MLWQLIFATPDLAMSELLPAMAILPQANQLFPSVLEWNVNLLLFLRLSCRHVLCKGFCDSHHQVWSRSCLIRDCQICPEIVQLLKFLNHTFMTCFRTLVQFACASNNFVTTNSIFAFFTSNRDITAKLCNHPFRLRGGLYAEAFLGGCISGVVYRSSCLSVLWDPTWWPIRLSSWSLVVASSCWMFVVCVFCPTVNLTFSPFLGFWFFDIYPYFDAFSQLSVVHRCHVGRFTHIVSAAFANNA